MKLFLLALIGASSAQAVPLALRGTDLRTGQSIEWSASSQPAVVVFLSPQCPCSRSHEPALAQLAKRHPDVAFLGIVSGESTGAAEHFRQAGLPFPVIGESGYDWADAFGALNTPHAFLIASGEVVYRGGVDDSRQVERASRHYLQEALADVKAGRKVAKSEARAVGCAIRR